MMKQKLLFLILILLILLVGIVIGWKLRDILWFSPIDNKSIFPRVEDCARDFHEDVSTLENVKRELGNPTNVDINENLNDSFWELYYRIAKEKDAGCSYLFDKNGILRKILLQGSSIS